MMVVLVSLETTAALKVASGARGGVRASKRGCEGGLIMPSSAPPEEH